MFSVVLYLRLDFQFSATDLACCFFPYLSFSFLTFRDVIFPLSEPPLQLLRIRAAAERAEARAASEAETAAASEGSEESTGDTVDGEEEGEGEIEVKKKQ
jgi:hypothetical protein